MIVYSPSITSRLRYVSDFIGIQLTGNAFTLTSNKEEFDNSQELRINYSFDNANVNAFWLKPHGLLNEKGIREQDLACFDLDANIAFFRTDADLEFDIFSAIFYLLSRYEEYLPHSKDMYGRYAHDNSLAFKQNFLQVPLVNYWLQYFKEKLIQKHKTSGTAAQLIAALTASGSRGRKVNHSQCLCSQMPSSTIRDS